MPLVHPRFLPEEKYSPVRSIAIRDGILFGIAFRFIKGLFPARETKNSSSSSHLGDIPSFDGHPLVNPRQVSMDSGLFRSPTPKQIAVTAVHDYVNSFPIKLIEESNLPAYTGSW